MAPAADRGGSPMARGCAELAVVARSCPGVVREPSWATGGHGQRSACRSPARRPPDSGMQPICRRGIASGPQVTLRRSARPRCFPCGRARRRAADAAVLPEAMDRARCGGGQRAHCYRWPAHRRCLAGARGTPPEAAADHGRARRCGRVDGGPGRSGYFLGARHCRQAPEASEALFFNSQLLSSACCGFKSINLGL